MSSLRYHGRIIYKFSSWKKWYFIKLLLATCWLILCFIHFIKILAFIIIMIKVVPWLILFNFIFIFRHNKTIFTLWTLSFIISKLFFAIKCVNNFHTSCHKQENNQHQPHIGKLWCIKRRTIWLKRLEISFYPRARFSVPNGIISRIEVTAQFNPEIQICLRNNQSNSSVCYID